MSALPNGMTKVPWGFVDTPHGLVATSTSKDRFARAELGEFAISLLGHLGVSEDNVQALSRLPDPMEGLRRLLAGQPLEPPAENGAPCGS